MMYNKIRSIFILIFLCSTLLTQAQHTAKGLEKLLKGLNQAPDQSTRAVVLHRLGLWYERDKNYEKEIQYLEDAYNIERKQGNTSREVTNLEHLAYAYQQLGLYNDAIDRLEHLLTLYKQQDKQEAIVQTHYDLVKLHKLNHAYKKAIQHNKVLIKLYTPAHHQEALVKVYADLGFLHQQTGKAEQAVQYYVQASKLNLGMAGKTNRQADLLMNIGFIHHRALNAPTKAQDYYTRALYLKQKTSDVISQAMLYNELAQVEYDKNNKKPAERYTKKALALTQQSSKVTRYSVQAKSYQLLAKLHAKDKNHSTSTVYYAQYLLVQQVLDSLVRVKHKAQQKQLKKIQYNQRKTKSRLLTKERRRSRLQDLILKQENEINALKIKEKEVSLLKKERALNNEKVKNATLEKDKIQQLLVLEAQKRLTAQQKAVAERQKMITEKQTLENEKKQQAIEAIEREKKLQKHKLEASQKTQALQQKELEHEKAQGRLKDYLFVLFGAVIVLVLMGLVSTVRSRKKLQVKNTLLHDANNEIKEQQEEILVQNEELHHRNEEIEAQRDAIEVEKNKSDRLLLNILPYATAQELKEKGNATPQHYPKVSVLFTDFKGFTKLAEKLTPTEVIAELNYCFSAFDDICQKYNIEKIKTIGDAYMAAGGIPVANDTNPIDTIKAGLEMQTFMAQWKTNKEAQGLPVWELRLGIHTGEVVAGVVGKNKFAYDVWGDTVNLAARMESSGAPGMVNISGHTYQLIKDQFETTYRGKIKAKNKGEVDMYFVKATQ
ncbi:adenylate/guanylate cyclase domain-containing protein [Microscilla marina]|uniref:Adenylate or guanylate cyclase n=1 Tax=Microscilla marina ATCC 23134 TaxID=313606 RepID=A1ZVN3_MICM2|nr:adenylate/guanylate cyclase domain-containing protein [Microscilla marina]EAY25576.1 adenylate or guanylate cyclase [Microscilla marina ATCC 23134]